MAEKQCAFVDEDSGNHCPRIIKSGLFCPVHDPANEKTVCYIREGRPSLKESKEEGQGLDCAAFTKRGKRRPKDSLV